MQEIVDEVLKIEETATRIIQEAKEKATRIRNEAEIKASDEIKQAKEKAHTIILDAVAHAKEEADITYKKAITDIEEKNKNFLADNEHKFDHLTEKIIKQIIVPEFERE
jgi:F0F1-type ATP synthase membrane subunit b/b'